MRRFWLLVFLGAVSASANNPYGVMIRSAHHDSTWASQHLGHAAEMVGEWGYTRTGESIHDLAGAKRSLIIHRAKKLIPIVNVGTEPAGEIAAFVQALLDDGYRIPYLEIGNETQGSWPAADYAAYLLGVVQAVKAVDPRVKVMNGGTAGAGADYIDDMFTAVPQLVSELDAVCCHPYPINYPPDHPDGFLSYLDTVAVMDAHGFTGPIVFTEFGYELGNQMNPAYPKITEELRAQYMVEIFTTYVENDPRILAACPFILGDEIWNGWADWDFIRFDRSHTPQFDAIAALPKPPGEDWLEGGPAGLGGRIVDPATGEGIQGVFVYILPGPYAAETGPDGTYLIEDVPEGTYSLAAFKDGYRSLAPRPLVLAAGLASLDLEMPRRGVFRSDFDSGSGGVAHGWQTDDGQAHPAEFAIDTQVKHSGAASQRILASAPVGIWAASDYCSIFEYEVWNAQLWYKTLNLTAGDGDGLVFRIVFRDNYFSYVDEARLTTGETGAADWTPLSMTFVVPKNARRMQVTLGLDATAGAVWVDDLIIDRANLPMPEAQRSPAGWLRAGWNMVSVPLRPEDPDPAEALDECGVLEGNLFSYVPGSGYGAYPGGVPRVGAGTGHWLRLDGPRLETILGLAPRGEVAVPLAAGWNLVGYPFSAPGPWAGVEFALGAERRGLAEAAEAGWVAPYAYCYDGGYRQVWPEEPADDTMLRPWHGYWVKSLAAGVEMVIPDPVGRGEIVGVVETELGAPVEDAVVSTTPGCYWDITDPSGFFTVSDIPAGVYDLRVTAPGFEPGLVEALEITGGGTTPAVVVLSYQGYPTDIQNPGFELPGEALPGWTRFGSVDGVQTGPWYADITAHSGSRFLGTAANWGAKAGGVYQKVQVVPGVSYDFSTWYCVYWIGGTPGERGCLLGVDPTGGEDPDADTVVWSEVGTEPTEGYWQWRQLEVSGIEAADPDNPVVTVFLRHFQRPGGIWNVNCFDDVTMTP